MHKRSISLLLSLIFFVGAVASAGTGAAPAQTATTGWLSQHLADPNVAVVHVGRDKAAFDAAHIPGARFLSLDEIAVSANGIPNEMPTVAALVKAFKRVGVSDKTHAVLYGDIQGLFAARAWTALDYLGVRKARLLDGGLEKWRAEGRPVSSPQTPSASAHPLTARVNNEMLVDYVTVRNGDKNVVFVDARSPKSSQVRSRAKESSAAATSQER